MRVWITGYPAGSNRALKWGRDLRRNNGPLALVNNGSRRTSLAKPFESKEFLGNLVKYAK